MQIHEITFGPKKINEGLLDTFKAAAKIATDPNQYAQVKRVADLSQADKLRQQINAKYGTSVQGHKPKPTAPATGVPPATATGVPPSVTAPTTTAKQQGGWTNRPGGVQIKHSSGKNPTLARYKKNLYSLTKNDEWIDQNGRPVNPTMSAFLDQALDDENDTPGANLS